MGKKVKLKDIRPGQLIKVTESYVNDDHPDPDYKTVETFVWIGRVSKVSREDGEEDIYLRRGGAYSDTILSLDGDQTLEIMEDVAAYDMPPGYYRYFHAKNGVTAIVHFDGSGFAHSDLSTHKIDTDYFGFDPKRTDTLFERIVQS